MTQPNNLEWQKQIFAEPLNRFDLLKLKVDVGEQRETIRVSRNHAFEQVASVLPTFLAFAGLSAKIQIGDYDDSLSLPPIEASIEVIWLDYRRYAAMETDALMAWLISRLNSLRATTRARIVVANCPDDSERSRLLNDRLGAWRKTMPGTAILDLARVAVALGDRVFDTRRAAFTGTILSDSACLEVARTLGLRILPELLAPPIKAVAVDLDNTLYAGVLGEDGISGLVLTDEHLKLHHLLVELAERGVLLTVISRNEWTDVENLFRSRKDFALKPRHIAKWKVSWGSKADAIREAALELRVGTDAFLFVDDNLGEITEVRAKLPNVRVIFAGYSVGETVAALQLFPALWSDQVSETDKLRVADLKANAERETLASSSLDSTSYLRALGVQLTFSLDPREDIARLRDISSKTNQFNLSLARLSDLDISNYIDDPDRHVVHFRMADRLADSGSVGALYARREGDLLRIDELCISCRALGRMLENIFITEAIRRVQEFLPARMVRFAYAVGHRNEPARNWLKAYSDSEISGTSGVLDIAWSADFVTRHVASTPVSITWKE